MGDPATLANDAPALERTSFLRAFHPAGPWVLSAIHPEPPKRIETRTFMPNEAADAEAWIERHNVERNIYFSVNLPNRRLTKKATKTDIHSVPWLHVDIDARALNPSEMEVEGRAAEHLAREIERIRLLVTDRCPTRPPTVIIFSGGGYQVFWKLEEPIETGGRLEAAEEVERYNRQLLNILDGDISAFNVDRIMRLPDTTNWPDEKKRKRGRVVARAEVCSFEPSLVYSLSQFTPAPATKTAGVREGGAPQLDTSNIVRLANVDELDKWKVPDRVKLIIVQGEDTDNPKDDDNSRSAWLFDAVCHLVRAEVPDDVIFSVITDPDFKISESVLEKAPNHARYAGRQIARAHEEVEDPDLREMNDRHCLVLNYGGRTRVSTEIQNNSLGRRELVLQSPREFSARYANRPLNIGNRSVDRVNWWLHHPKRREAESLVYLPGEDVPGDLNLWRGFAVNPSPGDKHRRWLAHVRDNICGGNSEHLEYLLGWMARAVQYPNSAGEVAPILRGVRGVGKGQAVKPFGKLWGQHYLHVADPKHLVGSSFNAHLRDCSVVFADEAFWAGDKKREAVLKALVTEETIMIEAKGVDAQPMRNVIHLLMASNEDWVVPAGAHERRFFVLNVSDAHRQDRAYFGAIEADMGSGGLENLLYFLQHYDLAGFDVRQVPTTAALFEQVQRTWNDAENLVYEMLETGRLPIWHKKNSGGRAWIAAWDLVPSDLKAHAELRGRELSQSIGRALKNIVDPGKAQRQDRLRLHALPSLGEARARWQAKHGFEISGPPEDWVRPDEPSF